MGKKEIFITFFLLLSFFLIGLIPVGLLLVWYLLKWPKSSKLLLTFFLTFWFIVNLFIFFRLGIRTFRVVENGMAPLYKEGAFIVGKRFDPKVDGVYRNEIFILRKNNAKKAYIARIIGIPGDEVLLRDKFLYVKGKDYFLKKKIKVFSNSQFSGKFSSEVFRLPNNRFLYLVDNTKYGVAAEGIGIISKDDIYYEVLFCYWNCR